MDRILMMLILRLLNILPHCIQSDILTIKSICREDYQPPQDTITNIKIAVPLILHNTHCVERVEECPICFNAQCNVVFVDCGHQLCFNCCKKMFQHTSYELPHIRCYLCNTRGICIARIID